MAISQQVLKKIEIQKLKGIKDLAIDFTEQPLVAIMAPNGVGKSTILHALACINKPVAGSPNNIDYKFPTFFIPTTHSFWNGSSFNTEESFRNGAAVTLSHVTQFRKDADRWKPRYDTRIDRYVSYIGIKACVPQIEKESKASRIQFNTTNALNDVQSNRVRQLAGEIMNKNYTAYSEHLTGTQKRYIGVTAGGINYSSLSMGAGEQRIFYILSEVIKAPNHALIIIDEIDLLLHQVALLKLIKKLDDLARPRNQQIIFTTHAQSILSLPIVAFRHLYQTPTKTLSFSKTKPDALHRLTGHQVRPLELFVEDNLAYALVKKICSEEGLSKYVSIAEYGAAINCFTCACGAILSGLDNQDNMLFILDGDEYPTQAEKEDKIARVLTGTTQAHDAQRTVALGRITQFVLPAGAKPELYYHSLICALPDGQLSIEQQEVVDVARQIGNPGDAHYFLRDIIERMDWQVEVGLSKLVDLVALLPEWHAIKANIKAWLDLKRDDVIEQ